MLLPADPAGKPEVDVDVEDLVVDKLRALLNPERGDEAGSVLCSDLESNCIESVAEVALATALKTTMRACCTMESSRAPVSNRMSALFNPDPFVSSGLTSKLAVLSKDDIEKVIKRIKNRNIHESPPIK